MRCKHLRVLKVHLVLIIRRSSRTILIACFLPRICKVRRGGAQPSHEVYVLAHSSSMWFLTPATAEAAIKWARVKHTTRSEFSRIGEKGCNLLLNAKEMIDCVRAVMRVLHERHLFSVVVYSSGNKWGIILPRPSMLRKLMGGGIPEATRTYVCISVPEQSTFHLEKQINASVHQRDTGASRQCILVTYRYLLFCNGR